MMSMLFNMLSRVVIAFLPRSELLLISWLQSPSMVILEPKIIKSVTAFTFSPSICREEIGPDAMILAFLPLSHWSLPNRQVNTRMENEGSFVCMYTLVYILVKLVFGAFYC